MNEGICPRGWGYIKKFGVGYSNQAAAPPYEDCFWNSPKHRVKDKYNSTSRTTCVGYVHYMSNNITDL